MMIKTSLGKEVIVKTLNDVGVLAAVSKLLSERGIGILAASAWVEGPYGIIHLVTDDHQRALECLHGAFDAREAPVIVAELPHKPGMLRQMSERLKAEGIDIHHLYATATPAQDHCLVVFATSYNERALVALR